MHEADKKLINAQRLLMGGAVIMGVLLFIIYYRKKKEESLEREHQMQLYAYTTEMNNLETKKENALAQIWELRKSKEEYSQKISELQKEANSSGAAIDKLNKEIRDLLNERAPKLKLGRLLYDHIEDGETISSWGFKETTAFNTYYAATHYRSYSQIMKVDRTTKLSAHNLFYLILKDMGKSDEEVRRIMGISPEGLRSLRSRTKPKGKE
jgi:seryl-tRNA synthetase